MPRIDSFNQLDAWRYANELADLIDMLVAKGAAADNQSFRDQILRSSSKPPAQIAEGFARFLPRESAYYYRIARASIAETQNHLRRGLSRRYWSEAEYKKAMVLAEGAFKTTGGLLASRRRLIEADDRAKAERRPRQIRKP